MKKVNVSYSATMTTELSLAIDVEVPDDLTDDFEIQYFLLEHAKELDGGMFVPDDSIFSGGWDVWDATINEANEND